MKAQPNCLQRVVLPFVSYIIILASCAASSTSGTKTIAPARSEGSRGASTVWAGVYTVAQAETGETWYGRKCASCHGHQLEGDEDFCAPALVGREFWKEWRGQSVGALFDRIQKTMPENQGGTLGSDEVAAIVSYVLKANEFPAGRNALPTEVGALKRIMITQDGPSR